MNGVKGIRVLTYLGNIEESCIWKSYWNIFSWRPPRNRMLLTSGVFGDEKETTEFLSKSKAKYVPTTATVLLETDDESAFLEAKEAQSDSEDAGKRAEKLRQKVARELTEFLERQRNGGNESAMMRLVIFRRRKELRRKRMLIRENRCAATMVFSAD